MGAASAALCGAVRQWRSNGPGADASTFAPPSCISVDPAKVQQKLKVQRRMVELCWQAMEPEEGGKGVIRLAARACRGAFDRCFSSFSCSSR
eukprot:365889-Chlamydomonas_euryale.AAC.17